MYDILMCGRGVLPPDVQLCTFTAEGIKVLVIAVSLPAYTPQSSLHSRAFLNP